MTSLIYNAIHIAALAIKLPILFKPLGGYFGSYHAIMAMMASMMLQGPFENWLFPRTFEVMNGEAAAHLIYYPTASLAAALSHAVFGGDLVFWGRLQAALFTAAAGWLLSIFVRSNYDNRTAGWTLLFFSFSPMVLLMGVSFQNEAPALFFLVASIYFLNSNSLKFSALAGGVCASIAILSRLHFLFPVVFVVLSFLLTKKGCRPRSFIFLFTAFLLPILWYSGAFLFETSHAGQVSTSLFSQSSEGRLFGTGIWVKLEFWKAFAGSWICLVVAPPALLLAIAGFAKSPSESRRFWLFWLAGACVPAILLPQKIWDHPFYLLPAVPPVAFFAASGALKLEKRLPRYLTWLFLLIFFVAAMRYYIPPAFSEFRESRRIVSIGQTVQSLVTPSARIITQHGTSADLMYYSGRLGWSIDIKMEDHTLENQERHRKLYEMGYGNAVNWLEKLRSDGAEYLVISEPEVLKSRTPFFAYLSSHYQTLPVSLENVLIYDLESH